MKKSILLSVGVMLLMSSMTLPATAFGEEEKPVCSIRSHEHNLYQHSLYVGSQEVKMIRHADILDIRGLVEDGLEYKTLGLCIVTKKAKSVCSIKEYRTSWNLRRYALVIDEDSLGPKMVMSAKHKKNIVDSILFYQRSGRCIIE